MYKKFIVLFFVLCINGCSVYLAMKSIPPPRLECVKLGADRSDVVNKIGPPNESKKNSELSIIDIYKYKLEGNNRSINRAVTHFCFSLVTLGAYEIFGSLFEIINDKKNVLIITYNAQNKIQKINEIKSN